MKGFAIVSSKHLELLPPHTHTKKESITSFLRKDYLKQSHGWELLHLLLGKNPLGFSKLTFPACQGVRHGVK